MPKKPTQEVTPRRSERAKKPVLSLYPLENVGKFAETASGSPKSKRSKKKAAPKPKSKAKGSKIQKKTKSKPTYEAMIKRALKKDLESLHSEISIAKFVSTTYPVPEGFKRYLKDALSRGVSKGLFVKHRASYRLSAKAKRSSSKKTKESTKKVSTSSKKKETTTKKTTKRTRTSSVKKSVASPKKKRSSTKETSSSSASASASPASSKKKKTSSSRRGKSNVETAGQLEAGSDEPTCHIPGCKFEYAWQYYHDGWRNYDAEASDVVEDVYQKYLENRGDTDVRAVQSGTWEYMVDFMAFKQTNIQHENHTVRDIRRVRNTATTVEQVSFSWMTPVSCSFKTI